MIQEFQDFPWHDAELKEIFIDRRSKDTIRILVTWPEDYGGKSVYIEFFNCYGYNAEMHFGFSPPDSIFTADCSSECEELDKLRKAWKAMGVDLSALYCFRIETNTTASIIKIFALGFREIPHPEKSLDTYIKAVL